MIAIFGTLSPDWHSPIVTGERTSGAGFAFSTAAGLASGSVSNSQSCRRTLLNYLPCNLVVWLRDLPQIHGPAGSDTKPRPITEPISR